MTERRPALTHLGSDIRIVGRRADGRAIVAFLDRFGEPIGSYAAPWPHELRGVGWHLVEIKRAIAAAPVLEGAPDYVDAPGASQAGGSACSAAKAREPAPGRTDKAAPSPAPRLHAHFALPEGDR